MISKRQLLVESPEPSPETKGIKTVISRRPVASPEVRNPALKPKGLRQGAGLEGSERVCPEPSPETKGIKTHHQWVLTHLDCPEPSPETKGIKTFPISLAIRILGPEPSPETKGIKTRQIRVPQALPRVRNPALKPKGLRPSASTNAIIQGRSGTQP